MFPKQDHQASYATVTTVVQVTAEPSDRHSQTTPPSTPTASITPVLPKINPAPPLRPWASHTEAGNNNDDDDDDIDIDIDIDLEQQIPSASRPAPANPNPAAPAFTNTVVSSITAEGGHCADCNNNKNSNTADPSSRQCRSRSSRRPSRWARRVRSRLANLDPVKLAYLRTSFVFALSVLATWAPSSINRVYALLYPARTSYALNLAGAVVLPLQGVWNAVIFVATTWSVLRDELRELVAAAASSSSANAGGGRGMWAWWSRWWWWVVLGGVGRGNGGAGGDGRPWREGEDLDGEGAGWRGSERGIDGGAGAGGWVRRGARPLDGGREVRLERVGTGSGQTRGTLRVIKGGSL